MKKKLKIIKIKLISYVRTEIIKNIQDIYIFLLLFSIFQNNLSVLI